MKIYEVKQTITSVQFKYVLAKDCIEAADIASNEDWKEKEEVLDSSLEVRHAEELTPTIIQKVVI
jgi:hypothetical protein